MWVLVTVQFWFEIRCGFEINRMTENSIKRLKSYKEKVTSNVNCKEFEDTCIKCWVIYLNKTIREHLNTLIYKICIWLPYYSCHESVTQAIRIKRKGIYFLTTPLCLRAKHKSLGFSNELFKVKYVKKKKVVINIRKVCSACKMVFFMLRKNKRYMATWFY